MDFKRINKVKEQLREANKLIREIGFTSKLINADSPVGNLSGGERQGVAIARAIYNNAELIILDEPTTALDVTIQAQILQLIKDIQKEENMSVLLITHDLGVVAETCEKVAVMYKGKIVEEASVDQIFTNPQHEYTKALLNAIPKGGKERLKVPEIGEAGAI